MPLVLLGLVIFQVGSCLRDLAGLNCNPSVYASQVAGMTGVHHHTQILLVEMGSPQLYAGTGF
jgi:hypothetical protein